MTRKTNNLGNNYNPGNYKTEDNLTMKTKKLSKKLAFNKQTISDLSTETLNNVRGGTTGGTVCNCPRTKIITFCPAFTCGLTMCEMSICPNYYC